MKRSLLLALLLPLLPVNAQVIRGRILDADAKPVAGAQVQVTLAERSPLDFIDAEKAITSEDGRYEIPAPPFLETESAAIAVNLPAHATVKSAPFQIGKGDLSVDVTLPRFERVSVHVTDRRNQPLAKARVAFATSADTASLRGSASLLLEVLESRVTTTDDAGDAVLHLVPGTWDFAAAAEDFQPATLSERVVKREASFSMMLEPAVRIRGRVHRNGAGVAGALVVILQGERRLRDDHPVVTDQDGAFEISGLPPGPYRLSVTIEDQLVRRIIETRAPAKLDVALPPAGTLRARIVDADTGAPVRKFFYSIESVPEGPDESDATLFQREAASEEGTVTTTLTAGRYRIIAVAAGYTLTKPIEVRVKESEPAEITIALDRGITLTGRVSDDAGAAVEGANIFVEGPENRDRWAGPGNGLTAADGSFSISGIEPGSASLAVRKDGFVPQLKTLVLDASTSIDVQLTRGLSLEGMVRRGGKPVADVEVSAFTAAAGGFRQSATSGADGRFVLRGLLPARYTVSASIDGVETQADNVDPAKTRELVLSLDPKPTGILHGTVTGIPTNLGGKITRRAVYVQGERQGVEGMIDEAGHYRIEDAPTGNVLVTAQLESTAAGRSSTQKRVEVIPGRELRVDFDLSGACSVRGRVTHDARPIADVRVSFVNDTGLAGSGVSRADGTYEVALPIAGTYQVFTQSETLPTGHIPFVREIRGGETVDIELREQTIEGIVVDAVTREPLEGAQVTLAPENARGQWHVTESITGPDGRFRVFTAASGRYRAVAWTRGYAQNAQLVQHGTASSAPLMFELTRTNVLHVRAIDAKTGTPLGSNAVVAGADGSYLPILCDRDIDGVSHLCSLAPGKYQLTVAVQGYADRKLEVTAPGRVDVLME